MKKQPPNTDSTPCPCGSQQHYTRCCAPLHTGTAAPTAEALMRSRYSAYVLLLEPYLLATWHSRTRPPLLDLASDEKSQWLGLAVKRHETTGADSAIVEFVARYKIAGRAYRLHETSRFLREDGRWYYVDGDIDDEAAKRPARSAAL